MFSENSWVDLLNSLLNYLAERLPSPLYNILLDIMSRSLVFLSSSLSFIASLPSSIPSDWGIRDVIPPFVTLLCAYLALVTLYRTTTWAIRTVFWFIKWGLILGLIFTLVGWHLRGTDQNWGAVDMRDKIIRTALESVNAHTRDSVGSMDGGLGSRTRRKPSSKARRPRPWDSFESHERWRERNQQGATDEIDPLKSVVDIASGILYQGGQWWMGAKSIISEAPKGERAAEQGKWDSKGKTKSRSR